MSHNATTNNDSGITTLPEGWEVQSMGNIGRYLNGFAFNSKTWTTTGRPIIRIQNLTGSGTGFNYFDGEIDDRYIVRNGDLLFSWSATLGVYVWRGPEAVLNQHIFKIESKINQDFHRYLIERTIAVMAQQTHGTGMVHITKKKFEALTVSIPPLEEQDQIVEILEEQLSRLDAALESVRVVREKAAQFRRSLLHAAFTGALTGHNPTNGEIPKGWNFVSIGEVASFVRGVTYKKSEARNSELQGYMPLLRATNLSKDAVAFEDFVFVPRTAVKSDQCLRRDDLVIATSSGSSTIVGKSAPIVTEFDGTFGAFCAVLRPSTEIVPRFLHLFAQSPIVRELWSNLARGTNINNLKREQVLSTAIPMPPLAEQQRIVGILEEHLSGLDSALKVADGIERRSAALRRSLLHAAFSGQLTERWRESGHV